MRPSPVLQDPIVWAVLALFALAVTAWSYRLMLIWVNRRSQRRLDAVAGSSSHRPDVQTFEPVRLAQPKNSLQQDLQQAGWMHPRAYRYTLMACAVTGVSAALVTATLLMQSSSPHSVREWGAVIGLWASATTLGTLLPLLMVKRWAIFVQTQAQRHLANALDLLGMSLISGLSLQQALERIEPVLRTQSDLLGHAFHEVGLLLKAGASVQRALPELERYVVMPEIGSLVNHLLQSEQLGTPIASILSQHAHSIRLRQQLQAKTRSGKIQTWLILPLVFCQLPALLAIMVGPSLIETLRILENMAR